MGRKQTNDTLTMMLVGGFIGASLAILFAPQSGKQTRKEIAKFSKKAGGKAQKFVGQIAESLDDVLDDVLQYSGAGLEKGKKFTEKAREEILEILDAGKRYLEEERIKIDRILK